MNTQYLENIIGQFFGYFSLLFVVNNVDSFTGVVNVTISGTV